MAAIWLSKLLLVITKFSLLSGVVSRSELLLEPSSCSSFAVLAAGCLVAPSGLAGGSLMVLRRLVMVARAR
jgi:hypothetical protein